MKYTVESKGLDETAELAAQFASRFRGGEVIELSGDLGTGKTAFVRSMMDTLGTEDEVSSPSFTIENIYRTDHFDVHHYDFHRLDEPGIMTPEMREVLASDNLVILEWAGLVETELPEQRVRIETAYAADEHVRVYTFYIPKDMEYLDVFAN
ncbi:MAG: tRNA (adenosine(37)-N6)-threonylcarbamoyltransferase complex ATPase subunit type 1 TsaE [Patescibacteria group bacterium]